MLRSTPNDGVVRFRSLVAMTVLGSRLWQSAVNSLHASAKNEGGDRGEITTILPQTLDQRFKDPLVEVQFEAFQAQDRIIRILLAFGLACAMLACLFEDFDSLSATLFIVTTISWASAAAFFGAGQASEWYQKRILQQIKDNDPLLKQLGRGTWFLLIIARIANAPSCEVITLVFLFGGNVLYTIANVLNGRKCILDGGTIERCLDDDGLDMNQMLTFLLICLLSPVRFRVIVAAMVAHLVALVFSLLFVAGKARGTLKLYAATILFGTQLAACTMMSYFREADRRHVFVTQREQELAVKQTEEVRRMAVETAARHIPDHVVRSLSTSGAYSIVGDGLVVGFALANFCHWSAGRGPRDVVNAVATVAEVYENAMEPLFSDPLVSALQLPKFGDTMMFTFLSETPEIVSKLIVDHVLSTVVVAVKRAEDTCSVLCSTNTRSVLFTPSRALEVRQPSDCRQAENGNCDSSGRLGVALHPLCAVASSQVEAWYERSLSCLMATGSAVDECSLALKSLSSVHHTQPRLHISSTAVVPRTASVSSPVFTGSSQQSLSHAESETEAQPLLVRHMYAAAVSEVSFPLSARASYSTMAACRNNSENETSDYTDKNPLQIHRMHRSPSQSSTISSTFHQSSIKSTFTQSSPCGEPRDADAEIQEEYRIEGVLMQRFAVDAVERAFEEHQASTFDVAAVQSNAVLMLAMGIAMLTVCALYEQMHWELRSPTPYVSVCCASAVALLILVSNPEARKYVWLLNTCYWVFCWSCFAASVFPIQESSIFGRSVFPWCLIAATVALLRPLWYGPFTMWSLELTLALCIILCTRLPVRHFAPFVTNIAIRMMVPACAFDLVIRFLLDQQQRAQFRWTKLLAATRELRSKESSHLIRFLDGFMPSKVAERILRQRISPNNAIGWLHMHHKNALITTIDDQPFALLQWKEGTEVAGAAASRRRSMIFSLLSEHIERYNDRGGNAIRLVKANDDMVLLASDVHVAGETADSLGASLLGVIDAVAHLNSLLVADGDWDVRCVVGACPMVGAVVGNRAPSFEWFASEISATLQVLRMSDDKLGPVMWGNVACTQRARYYIECFRRSGDKESTEPLRRRNAFFSRLRIKVRGVPQMELSLVALDSRRPEKCWIIC